MDEEAIEESLHFLNKYVNNGPIADQSRSRDSHWSPNTTFKQSPLQQPRFPLPSHAISPSSTPSFTRQPQYSMSSSPPPPNVSLPTPAQVPQPSAPIAIAASGVGSSSASMLFQAGVDSRQQFLAVSWFLRKRYSTDPDDNAALGTLTDEDVNLLIDCFAREFRGAVHKDRSRIEAMQQGASKKVNFAPPDLQPPPAEPPAITVSSSRPEASSKSSSAKGVFYKTDPSSSSQPAGLDKGPAITAVPAAAALPPRLTLKEGMQMLRAGEFVMKYSREGKPQRRFLRVLDRHTHTARSDDVIAPCLCWSANVQTDPGSSQLSLLTLLQVSLARLSRNVKRKKNEKGELLVDGIDGEMFPIANCLFLSFESRGAFDIAFRSREVAERWAQTLELVLAKNLTLPSS